MVSPGANFEKCFEELSALPAHQPSLYAQADGKFNRYGLPILTAPVA
ncbi:MAG: hypothetical protein WD042_01405 [Phycisphaeraceae bacterium]